MVRVFANGPGDQGSIPGWVIPKSLKKKKKKKKYLIPLCLTLGIVKVWIKGIWGKPGKGLVPSPTPWCSSYWKGSLQVTLDYGWPTYIYIYIYIHPK